MNTLRIIEQMIYAWQYSHYGKKPNIILLGENEWNDIRLCTIKSYNMVLTEIQNEHKIYGITYLIIDKWDYLYVGEISDTRRV